MLTPLQMDWWRFWERKRLFFLLQCQQKGQVTKSETDFFFWCQITIIPPFGKLSRRMKRLYKKMKYHVWLRCGWKWVDICHFHQRWLKNHDAHAGGNRNVSTNRSDATTSRTDRWSGGELSLMTRVDTACVSGTRPLFQLMDEKTTAPFTGFLFYYCIAFQNIKPIYITQYK